MKKSLLLFGLCFASVSASAHAALTMVYSTDFNAPTYTDAGLIGQDGWAITGSSVVSPVAVSNTATNGKVGLVATGQDVNRVFTPVINAGSVWLKATINVTSAAATGDYFLHLGDGGASNFNARIYARSESGGYVLAMGTSSGTTGLAYGTTVISLNSDQVIMVRYDFVPGALNDTGAIFLNPTSEDGTGDTPYVAATTIGVDAVSISSVNLRQGTAANAPVLTIDNIVVSVPEPSTALLGLLAGLGLMRRRR
jgi:trimeric autotransporter adhesin